MARKRKNKSKTMAKDARPDPQRDTGNVPMRPVTPSTTSDRSVSERNGPTLDQRRASFALVKVKDVADKDCAKEYRAYIRSLPSVIIANGLGQAVALELAQSSRGGNIGAGHGLLRDHVSAWLVEGTGWGRSSPYFGKVTANHGEYRGTDIIKAIVEGSDSDLARAQIETMAFVKWLKIFSEALIDARKDENESAEAAS